MPAVAAGEKKKAETVGGESERSDDATGEGNAAAAAAADDEDALDYEEEEAGAIANKALGVVETAASGPDTVTLHSRFVPDDVSASTLRRALRSIPGFVRVGFSVPHAQRQKVRKTESVRRM